MRTGFKVLPVAVDSGSVHRRHARLSHGPESRPNAINNPQLRRGRKHPAPPLYFKENVLEDESSRHSTMGEMASFYVRSCVYVCVCVSVCVCVCVCVVVCGCVCVSGFVSVYVTGLHLCISAYF